MKLTFEDRYGKQRVLGHYKTKKGAWRRIHRFCEEHSYKIPYIRMTETEDYIWYDVGSHSEFFYLYKDKEDDTNDKEKV